jgi:hypothetical protein
MTSSTSVKCQIIHHVYNLFLLRWLLFLFFLLFFWLLCLLLLNLRRGCFWRWFHGCGGLCWCGFIFSLLWLLKLLLLFILFFWLLILNLFFLCYLVHLERWVLRIVFWHLDFRVLLGVLERSKDYSAS